MDDWVFSCRKVEVAGVMNRKTWGECVDDNMKGLGLRPGLSGQFSGICGGTSYG